MDKSPLQVTDEILGAFVKLMNVIKPTRKDVIFVKPMIKGIQIEDTKIWPISKGSLIINPPGKAPEDGVLIRDDNNYMKTIYIPLSYYENKGY